jgi:hypothetical protein
MFTSAEQQANSTDIPTPTNSTADRSAQNQQQTTSSLQNCIWWILDTIRLIPISNTIIMILLTLLCYYLYKIANKLIRTHDDPQVPKTYNNSLNFTIWFNQVEQYLDETNTTSDNNKIDLVLSKLDSKSKKTIKELMKGKVIKTYKDLQEHLRTFHSSDTLSHQDHVFNLLDCRQKANESLHHYYTQVSELAKLAYPQESDKMLQIHIDKQFIAGLYNTLIKGQLLMKDDKKNVLSQAIQLQNKLGDAATELNIPIATSHIKSIRHRSTNNSECHSNNSCNTITQPPHPNNQTENQMQTTSHNNSRPPRTCFNCGKIGHLQANCRSPKNNQSYNNERGQYATDSRSSAPYQH